MPITRIGNLLRVRPNTLEAYLAPFLTWKRTVRVGQGNGARFTTENVPMYVVKNGDIYTYAGFLWRLIDLLKPMGEDAYEDTRDASWLFPLPCTTNLGDFRHKQDEALKKIWASDMGIIHCSVAWGKTEEILKVIRSYKDVPDYPIAVVSPGSQMIGDLMRRAAGYGLDLGLIDGSHNRRRQINVVSAFSLEKYDEDGSLRRCRLCLFDEVHRAAAPKIRMALSKMVNARMFGFTGTLEGRGDRGEIVIEGLFGRTITRVTFEESKNAGSVVPMSVVMMETDGPAKLPDATVAKTRHGIWRNRERNQQFAAVAEQLLGMGQVLILVKTLEHGLNIFKELNPANWVMVYRNDPADVDESDEEDSNGRKPSAFDVKTASWRQRRVDAINKLIDDLGVERPSRPRLDQLRADFASGKIRGAVATNMWGTGVDFPSLQFLLVPPASSGRIEVTQFGGRAARVDGTKVMGVIVDAEDDFEKSLAGRKTRRLAEYKRQGWTVLRHVSPMSVASVCQQLVSVEQEVL